MTAALNEVLTSHKTGRAIVMGILNVTPDSFSDGGRFLAPADAIGQARRMVAEGADIIDIGAESTRPGSDRVAPAEQIERLREILPVVTSACSLISIDTTSSKVAEFALDAGAAIVNDVSAGRDDPRLLPLVAERQAPLVLMHMLGEPKSMQSSPQYDDVVAEVRDFLAARLSAAAEAGVAPDKCIVDPGIGFGKSLAHNLSLMAGVGQLCELGCPVLIGPSRKRFIGELTGIESADQRGPASVAACLETFRRGATIFRVHDVRATATALTVAAAINNPTVTSG